MFTFIGILIWIAIIGTLIWGFINFILNLPEHLKELRLKNEAYKRLKEEEKWRQGKELEYLAQIEWMKVTPDIYQSKKNKNPYRRDVYYSLPEEFRGYHDFKKYGYDFLNDCSHF